MPRFQNAPQMDTNKVRRYVHSPLTIEHNGINAAIQANGKIVISKVASTDGDTVEFDEVEIPASLVFKLSSLLRATRKIEYVSIAEAGQYAEETQE